MKKLVILAAILALTGCSVGAGGTGPSHITYHITCYSGGTKIWEGEGSNLFIPSSGPAAGFNDEDGEHVIMTVPCTYEQNAGEAEYEP